MKYSYKLGIIMILVVIAALVTSMLSSGLLGLQHKWYNTSESGNQVPCYKCHQNIYNEYETPGNIHYRDPFNMNCEDCHRNQTGYTYASGGNPVPTPGKEAHAASVPPCQQCHIPDTTNITHANESHMPSYENSSLNEACIMCHTGFDKSMNFKRALYVEYDLVYSGGYEIQNFNFTSSNSTVINLTPSGSKHTWENASEINCFDCHSDVKSALENEGHVPKSDYTTGRSGGGQDASQGHLGRRHNFDRSNVTIDSCKPCHLSNASDFGSGYTHPEAQLDYHAATTEHCYNCHYNGTPSWNCQGKCHVALKENYNKQGKDINHPEILGSMFSQNFCWYQIDKVCVGCHMPGYETSPVSFGNEHFKVYTEPNTAIIVT